jgi:glycosyltransferase involved in cell wall biosynthesis
VPTVSVTIPCYNGESYIETAIRSVLAQTFSDLEIVVIDDGSHDRTGEIVQGFKDDRIRYFYQENQGLAETRNRLINLAKGEYIGFLDQDDYWEPTKLERQIAVFRNDPEIVLVYADCYIVDAGGNIKGKWSQRNKLYRGQVLDRLLQVNFVPIPTVLMRKAVFADIGGFQSFSYCEEYDVFLRCAAKHPFEYVAKPLASYRVHPAQFSKNYEIALSELLAIYDTWQQRQKEEIKISTLSRALAMAYYNAGKSAIYLDGSASKARDYFRRSLVHCPLWRAAFFYGLSFLGPAAIKRMRNMAVRVLGTYSLSQ